MQIDDLFFVVGNGPSLKPQVLDSLPAGRWIGMNAAYKYWDKTGKYPHFYSCLDPVVVVQHKDAILRMLIEERIAEFFLHEEILTVAPELADDPRVTLRNDFLASQSVLPISPLSNYKQTTGVLATRFCIERGFRNLCLLGIDCNYVERLDEAQSGTGYELVIKDNVRHNPNYFFDSYQEKNEKYQVPNPEVHSGNLHLQSFIALRGDVENSGSDVRITVGSRESLLSRFNVFSWIDVDVVLGLRRLEAIAVPLVPHELDGFLERLDYWVDPKLQPSFGSVKGVALHIFLTCADSAEIRGKIEAAATRLPWLSDYFSDLRVTFLDIARSVDYYVKGTSLNVFCNKSGPNIFWLMIMEACREYRFTFLMEADCVPVRPGWIDALEQVTRDGTPGTWIIGAGYSGPTMTSPTNSFHINGNAVYATGDRDFQDYLRGDFLRALQWMATNISNNVAYDVAFALGMQNYKSALQDLDIDLRQYLWRYAFTPTIRNISGQAETEGSSPVNIMNEVRSDVAMYLCHGQPALRWMVDDFDRLGSFYFDDPTMIREIRIDTTASLTKFVSWKNHGYGTVVPALVSGQKTWPQVLCINVGAKVATCQGGRLELRLSLEKGLHLAKADVFVLASGKPKNSIPAEIYREDSDVRIYLASQACTGGFSDVSCELTLRVEDPTTKVLPAISALRLLHLPEGKNALPVTVMPKSEAVTAVETRWADWLRQGQAQLEERYSFIRCIQAPAMPILKECNSKPAAVFEQGIMKIPLSAAATARLRFGTKPRLSADQDVHLSVKLTADVACSVGVGGKAFGYSIVEKKETLDAGAPRTIELYFKLDPEKGSDFFLSFDARPFQSPLSHGTLTIENITVLKTPQFADESMKSQATFQRIISINPDAESFFGHFLNYEVRLGKAVRAQGMTHIIAGPVDGELDVYEAHPEMEKVFSVRTNGLYAKTPGDPIAKLADFEAELDRFLAGMDQSGPSLLFMYCGSLEIAEVLGRLADRYPNCHFAISLYYLSWLDLDSEALRQYWKPKLAALAAHPRMRLIVPSPQLADELKTSFGVTPEILPHPTTTFHDDELGKLRAGSQDGGQITVVFPGNQRGGKGYELTRDAILALLAENPDGLRLRVRIPPDDSLNDTRRAFFESISDRVDLLDSYLDEKEFRDLLLSADLVVLPYTPDRFFNRTSGLLIDSLLLGIPCIVIRDTWLEWIVQDYGFGLAAAESGKDIAAGIVQAMKRLGALKSAALMARDRYTNRNSWDALTEFLATPQQAAATSAAAASLAQSGAGNRRLLLIGNGPSTRILAEAGFDKIPADMDTWGTTAAFRYFERIGWWPTWYALADRKVVFHHRKSFARLLDDPKVTTKRFFLSWKVSDSPKLELISHSSTGSFSLKKAVELGYKEIYLIGMEGAYVEEILESRPLSSEEIAERGFGVLNLSRAESKLRILDRTPTYNPNYFFAGYQQKGDVYSLPQAHTHQANWDGVKAVVKEAGAKVVNLSRISKINAFERGDIRDVFPFLPENCWEDMSDPFAEKAQHVKSVFSFQVGAAFTQKAEREWVYRPKEGEVPRALRALFGHVGITKGRTLVAGATVTANRSVKIGFGFGRQGATEYEGTGRLVALQPGTPVAVKLCCTFRKRHQGLKLQISDIDLLGAQDVRLQLDNIWLAEAVDSVVARHEAGELTERRAEQAFEQGNDSFALAVWLHLRGKSADGRYDDKIARTAGRIGLPEPAATDKLSWLLAQTSNGVTAEAVARVASPGPTAPMPEENRAKAARLLISCAANLLLDPAGTYPKLVPGGTLSDAVSEARNLLGPDDGLVHHFARVMQHVEQHCVAYKRING